MFFERWNEGKVLEGCTNYAIIWVITFRVYCISFCCASYWCTIYTLVLDIMSSFLHNLHFSARYNEFQLYRLQSLITESCVFNDAVTIQGVNDWMIQIFSPFWRIEPSWDYLIVRRSFSISGWGVNLPICHVCKNSLARIMWLRI